MRFKVCLCSALLSSSVMVPVLDRGAEARPRVSHKPHPAARSVPPSGRTAATPRRTSLESAHPEEISVTAGLQTANGPVNVTPGGGLMPRQTAPRAQSGITREFVSKQAPTQNISSLVASLPGVNYQSADPLGLTSDSLSVRGLNASELGYLFEGAPIADPISYGPITATLIDSENIGGVTVTQGSSDLTAPLFNAVGGQVSAQAIDPSRKSGWYFDGAGGTHSTNKEFIRYQTGEILHSGVTAYASFSHAGQNEWRGPGKLKRYHVDAKVQKTWRDNSVSAIFSYNRQEYNFLTNPTKQQWDQFGTSYNYLGNYTPGETNYYKLNRMNVNLLAIIVPAKFHLADNLTLHVVPYYTDNDDPSMSGANLYQQGGYFGTQQYANLNAPYEHDGQVTVMQTDTSRQKVGGINSYIDWKMKNNTFSIGYWYSYASHTEKNVSTPVNFQGGVSNSYGKYPLFLPDGRELTTFDINFFQQINVLDISDRLSLLGDRLKLGAGFRAAMVSRHGTNLVPGADPYKSGGTYFEPLPQVTASYDITPRDQIFINGTTAFRAPSSVQAYIQIFNQNTGGVSSQPGNLRPEYAISEEIGYRHTGPVNVSVSLFNMNITNHQVTSSSYLPGTTTLVSQPINMGGQTSRGVQVEASTKTWHHFSFYTSGQYLHATMDNNYDAGPDYLPTAGKVAVYSPKFLVNGGITYDDGHVFGNFLLQYTSKQYSTFMNDESVPSYIVSNISLGYRMSSFAGLNHPQVQLNVINLGSNNYLSGINGVAGTAHARTGIFGNLVNGSSPTYVVGGGFAMLASFSTGF